MRRLGLLSLAFPLVLAGCGGSGSGPETSVAGLSRLFSVDRTDSSGLTVGTRSDGTPTVGRYELPARTLKLTSPQGASGAYAIPEQFSMPQLTGDFALSPGNPGPARVNVLDLRTGESRVANSIGAIATDGDRVVWSTPTGPVLENLKTGESAPIGVGVGEIRAIAGDRVLAQGSNGGAHSTYAVYAVSGAKVADLTAPEGYEGIDVTAVNARGEAVGVAYLSTLENGATAYRLVRWSAAGTPTVETSRLLKPGGIADDGTVAAIATDGRIVLVRDGESRVVAGAESGSTLRLDRGGALFVTTPQGRITAYRLR